MDKISTLRGSRLKGRVESFPHLRNLPLADEDSRSDVQEVDVLIGLDFYHDIISGETIRGGDGPVATKSIFGYIISGAIEADAQRNVAKSYLTTVLKVEHVSNEEIYSEVKKFWENEAIGIKEETEDEGFNINIEKRNDRYYVNLPWKKDHGMLCDNYELSRKRLMNILKKLQKQPELLKEYCDVMDYQEKRGIIEEVVDNKNTCLVGRTYYMPHHAVIK